MLLHCIEHDVGDEHSQEEGGKISGLAQLEDAEASEAPVRCVHHLKV